MLKISNVKYISCLLTALLLFINSSHAADTLQHEPDKALLSKFELLCKKIGNTGGNYSLGGVINITDNINPAAQMNNVDFLFCKQRDEFYYKLGNTVTINGQGSYLVIDNQYRRIMLSAQKIVQNGMGLQQFGELGTHIKSENYVLSSKINGDVQTLSLINEHHISCKQYSITFNKNDLKIKSLYMRLTNLNDPLNKKADKIVNIAISKWDSKADITKYLTKSKVIKQVNGRWKPVNAFKDYQLVKM